MDDDRERVHRLTGDQNLDLHEVGGLVALELVVERRVAAGPALQSVEEVRDDLRERQVVRQLHPPRRDVLHPHGDPAPLVAEAHHGAHVLLRADERRPHDGLPDLLEDIRQVAGVRDLQDLAVHHDLVPDARRRGYEVQVELPLQPLLDYLHVEEPQEPASEAEPHPRVLRLEEQRGVVELQLRQSLPETLEIVAFGGVQAAKHRRQRLGIARQRLSGRVFHLRYRVAHAQGLDILEAGDDVAYLAGVQGRERRGFGRVATDLQQLEPLLAPHRLDLVALLEPAVYEAGQRDDAPVGVVVGVEDKGARLFLNGLRGRDAVHHGIEDVHDTLAGLGGDLQDVVLVHAQEFDELLGHRGHVGDGEVDLVEYGYDLQIVLHRQVQVRERLRLDALARVHDEESPLTRRYSPRDLVSEVDVPRGVYEVQRPLAIVAVVDNPDSLGLDGNAALPLDIHRVQDLGHPLPLGDGLGNVQKSVG